MLKKFSFDKNRIFNFTDAVFSIAITLLVLEISVPTYLEIKEKGFQDSLLNTIPDFIGFFVSFMVIALYWRFYLTYSRYIVDFDNKLLQLNTYILLFVVLLPFSTAFFVENTAFIGPFSFYSANLVFLSFFMYLQLNLVLKRAKLMLSKYDRKYLRFRGILPIAFWIAIFILSLTIFPFAKLFIPLIFVIQWMGKKYFEYKSN